MPKYKRSPTIHATPFLPRHSSRFPTPRRLKLLTLLVVTFILFLLYRSSGSSPTDLDTDFYHKTKSALEHDHAQHDHDHDHSPQKASAETDPGDNDEDDDLEMTKKMSERLQQAAQMAKDKANAKAPKPDPPSSVIGVGSASGGKKKDKDSGTVGVGASKGEKPNMGVAGAGGTGRRKSDEQKPLKEETKEDHEVEVELNAILKKAPIIIFSKSYCKHSKRAKDILLQTYIISPPPYVVELDKHPLGLNLQSRLAELTNRRTVPNVLINGVSIGGGDDIAELDETKQLVAKIKDLGGNKITEARPRAGSNRERTKEKEKVAVVHGSDSSV